MQPSFSALLDRQFGIHAPALQFRSERSRVLASNLANADTPNYKARDLSFGEVLAKHGKGPSGAAGVGLTTTHSRHVRVGSTGSESGALLYRNPYQPSLDGNTVEADVEQAAFARNAVQYQASLMFLTGKIRGLRLAITGTPS